MVADFQNSFTFGFSTKFAIKHLLCFPPHLNCVATLPCEMQRIKNGENLIYSTQ